MYLLSSDFRAIASSSFRLDYSTLLFNCPYCRKFLFKLPSTIKFSVLFSPSTISFLDTILISRPFFAMNPQAQGSMHLGWTLESLMLRAWPKMKAWWLVWTWCLKSELCSDFCFPSVETFGFGSGSGCHSVRVTTFSCFSYTAADVSFFPGQLPDLMWVTFAKSLGQCRVAQTPPPVLPGKIFHRGPGWWEKRKIFKAPKWPSCWMGLELNGREGKQNEANSLEVPRWSDSNWCGPQNRLPWYAVTTISFEI